MTTHVTHCQSSKGPLDIAKMPISHALNARNRLQRAEPAHVGEIAALDAHIERLSAQNTDEALNPRAVLGGNNPPPDERKSAEPEQPVSWSAVKAHMDDLLAEADNWARDDEPFVIENQGQADAIARLRQDLQDAIKAADDARQVEKKPLDERVAEIQNRYNAYIAPIKNRAPGTVSKAVAALGNILTGWLNKLDAEKKARERESAEKAAAAAAEAIAARAEAKEATDLNAMDAAEDKLAAAKNLIREAEGIAKEKVHAQGSRRAVGLRSVWVAKLNDGEGIKAVNHYLKTRPDDIRAFIQSLADKDVREGKRAIPGFTIREEKRV